MNLPISSINSSSSTNSSSSSSQNIQPTLLTSNNLTITNSIQSSPLFGLIYADPDSTTTINNNSSTSNTPIHFICNNNNEYKIKLANLQLWEKFARLQNEMVVTKPGRKIFPKLELHLYNLDPKAQYTLFLYMQKVDNLRYRYQAGGWSAAGHDGDNGIQQSNFVQHHEGWNKGEFWSSQERVSFERAKLTNKESQQGGNSMISLSSMSKYQPVVLLCKFTPTGAVVVADFRPPQCQFIAVTAYQSKPITDLKIEYNPFAKGFREGSSRKRTLSPPSASPFINPSMLISNQFPSSLIPQHSTVAASDYFNFMQNLFQQYQQKQQNHQQQSPQFSPSQFSSFSPTNIFGQAQQFNTQQVRLMANQMLGAMGMFGNNGGIPFSSEQLSPIYFPSTTEPFKTSILQNKKEIEDVHCTPTKAKKAKMSNSTNCQVSQQSPQLISSTLIEGNSSQLANNNKTLTTSLSLC